VFSFITHQWIFYGVQQRPGSKKCAKPIKLISWYALGGSCQIQNQIVTKGVNGAVRTLEMVIADERRGILKRSQHRDALWRRSAIIILRLSWRMFTATHLNSTQRCVSSRLKVFIATSTLRHRGRYEGEGAGFKPRRYTIEMKHPPQKCIKSRDDLDLDL